MRRRGYGWLLGEALVIVLGVLLALAVDRAMQGVDQATLEKTALESLLRDLEDAGSEIQQAHDWAVLRDGWGRNLLAVLNGRNPPAEEFAETILGMELLPLHYPLRVPRDTWDDLVGTAQLNVLTNPDLRRDVSRFYRSVELMMNLTDRFNEMSRAYNDDLRRILPADWRLEVRTAWVNGESFPSASDPIFEGLPPRGELLTRVRSWPELESHLGDVLLGTTTAAATYADLKTELESVILTVKAELAAF